MLVLARKVNEEIVITLEDGREIKLMLIEIRGDKARIGCSAPPSIIIHRKEVADAIAAERRAADTAANPGLGEDFG